MASQYMDKDGLIFLMQLLSNVYVAQESGKVLSTNDFTNELLVKLNGVAAEASKVVASDTNGYINVNGVAVKVYQLGKTDVTTALGFTPLTPAEVTAAIGAASHLKREIVSQLPTAANANANTIYMLLERSDSEDDKYTEWMVINGAWERIGSSNVDLSGYVKTSDIKPLTNSEIEAIVKGE